MIDARVITINRSNSFASTIWNAVPNIRYKFALNDKGDASWVIPQYHDNLTSVAPSAALDIFGPKRCDYRIGVRNTEDNVGWVTAHSGICGPVGLKTDSQVINCVGADYLAWLDQPWKFSGYNKAQSAWLAGDVIVSWTLTSQQSIIGQLIANLWDGSDTTSLQIIPEFQGSGWGQVLTEFIVIGDNNTVLDKIKGIGAYSDPYGFEFTMVHNASGTNQHPAPHLVMWSPARNTNPTLASIVADFTPSNDSGLHDIDWTNKGPNAVTTIGIPVYGPAFVSYKTYAPSASLYRDWWQIKTFGDAYHFRSQTLVDNATDAVGTLDRRPQKDDTITFDPEIAGLKQSDPLFWFKNQVGQFVYVDSEDWFLPYHRIEAIALVTSQELSTDDSGNWTCVVTLDQTNAT